MYRTLHRSQSDLHYKNETWNGTDHVGDMDGTYKQLSLYRSSVYEPVNCEDVVATTRKYLEYEGLHVRGW